MRPSTFNMGDSNSGLTSAGSLSHPLVDAAVGTGKKKTYGKKDDIESQVKDCVSHSYWHCVKNWDEDFENILIYLTTYVLYFCAAVIGCFVAYYFSLVFMDYDNTAPAPPPNSNPLTIVLLGDSLINRPYNHFNLAGLLYGHLQPINATFINAGVDGDTIHEIAARLVPILDTYHPDAVMLFWDSDISDNNEADMTEEQVYWFRYYYKSNLTWVINTTLNYGTEFMAVAGPGLLGETRICQKMKFQGKNPMLDTYRGFNANISATMGVPYIDIRTQLQNKVPWIWPLAFYFVTQDGEHMNYRGVHILSKLFGDSLRGWITSRNNETTNTTNEVTLQAVTLFEQRKIQLRNLQQLRDAEGEGEVEEDAEETANTEEDKTKAVVATFPLTH